MGFVLALALVVVISPAATAGEEKYDESTPMEELKAASDSGHTEAMVVYGMRLLQGEGEEANVSEGLDWLHKAADAGDAHAWYALGAAYANAIGVELDFAKAIDCWRKGAEAGDADCQTSMGMVYQAGDRIPTGIEADPAEAAKWYRMAAEQDNTEAIWHLAGLYARGIGVEQNDEEALVWLRRGAELGSGDCIWGLGRCYLKGEGVTVDSVMAYALMSACLDGIHFPEQKKAITAKRDELGKALTAEQLAQAEPIIKEWKAKVKE
jgi:TPR repeat protein